MKVLHEADEVRNYEAEWSRQLPLGKDLIKAVQDKDYERAAGLLSACAKSVLRMFKGETEQDEDIRQECEYIARIADGLFYDDEMLDLDIEDFDDVLNQFYDICDNNDILIPTREVEQ